MAGFSFRLVLRFVWLIVGLRSPISACLINEQADSSDLITTVTVTVSVSRDQIIVN